MTAHSHPRAESQDNQTRERHATIQTDMAGQSDLTGLRVLVLEDEPLLALAMEDLLIDLGCQVLGPFLELDDAIDFVHRHSSQIDVAVLDINIHGILSFGLAEQLAELGTPFFFCTGYKTNEIDLRWRNWPRLDKFFTESGMTAMLLAQTAKNSMITVPR